MTWNDGVDRATGYLITATNFNDLLGATGSLMELKLHTHDGTAGDGSSSLGPLVLGDFTDAAAPAAPGAGKTRLSATSGRLQQRAGAAGATQILAKHVMTTQGDIVYGGALGDETRLPKGTAAQVLQMNAGATAPEWAANAPTVSLTTASANLGADVALTGTYADGPTISLTAGTWFVVACAVFARGSMVYNAMRISDGTTHYASTQNTENPTYGAGGQAASCAAIITLSSTTTIKLQALSDNSATLKAANPVNGASGNVATHIRAVKVAP